MSQKESNWGNSSCVITIGLIASLIAIFVFISGKETIGEVLGWAANNNPQAPIPQAPIQEDSQLPSGSIQPASETIQLTASSIQWPGRILLWFEKDGNVQELTSNGNLKSLFPVPPSMNKLMRWSPDGKRIAYSGKSVDGKRGIFVMDSDGTNGRMVLDFYNLQVLDHYIRNLEDLTWSSESDRILMVAQNYGFLIVDVETGKVTELGYCDNDIGNAMGHWPRVLAWSEDNSKIAFWDAHKHLVAVRPTESGRCTVWLEEYEFSHGSGPLIFSKDGSELFYSSEGMLYRIPAPGTALTRVVPMGRIPISPVVMVWSPDYRYLAMRGFTGTFVVDTITGTFEQVLKGNATGKDSVGWLP